MKFAYSSCTLIVYLFASLSGAAQNSNDYRLLLKNGSFTPVKNVSRGNAAGTNLRIVPFNSKSFVVIQFEKIPDEEEKKRLKNAGIELLDYIPNYAYTATVTGSLNADVLTANHARAIINLSAEQKMQPGLANGTFPAHAIKVAGNIDVWINYPRSFSFEEIRKELENQNFEIISDLFKNYQVVSLRVPFSRLKELGSLTFVQYIQAIPPADQPVNSKANSKANILNSSLPGGPNLLGQGVVVGVGDNADPLQHIDFSGRLINRTSNVGGSHGLHVMGIVGGAGIVNERYSGYAPKSTIVVQNNSNIITMAPIYVKDFGMVITNNSYGGDVNNCHTFGSYDLYSSILDQQAFEMPYLQHVFAAGNSGYIACSPFPVGFSSILSGYQTAKNVLTVGNTSDTGEIGFGSSKGPVRDGRIKPEIMAEGESVFSTIPKNSYGAGSGTSMATPAVSGGLALLYQRFRQLHQDSNPKNALMKALISNSGTDKGNEGPDYSYGFGWMNLLRSLKMLENNAYQNDSVSNGSSKTITINVPDNTAQLKVMLYWNDPASAILTSRNLVNNLDLTVTNPSSAVTLPKLLDPTPANANNTATTGIDNVNNIEQVVINNPVAGAYTVTVKGSSVVQNPNQEYFIVYDAIPVSTTLTYPIGNEHLTNGDAININWDSFGNPANNFTVQYSVDNGTNWINIGSNLPASVRQLGWTIPSDINTDKARVKVVQNDSGVESVSEVFTILGVPNISLAATQCEGYINLNWTSVSGATDYEVMMLKGDEMVSVATTSSNNYIINNLAKDVTYWLSVRARSNGHAGRRAIAISRKPDTGDCAGSISDNDLKIDSILSPVTSGRKNTSTELGNATAVKLRIKNLDNVNTTGSFTVGYSVNGVNKNEQTITPDIEAGKTFDYTFPNTEDFSAIGNYDIKVFLNKADDPVQGNNSLSKTFRQISNEVVSLPFWDDAESLPEQTYLAAQTGFTGADRYDFSTDSDAGRIRTFVNSGIANSGSKAFTLDASYYNASKTTSNFLYATFNLSRYHVATDDIRFDFVFKNHGNNFNVNNHFSIRGKDTDEWIQVYSLTGNQNFPGWGYKEASEIEISRILAAHGKELSSSFQVRWAQEGKMPTSDEISGAGYSFDDIKIYKVIQNIQAVGINFPLPENCGLGNAESISVKVRNSANEILFGVPVKYQVGNGEIIREIIPSLAGRADLDYVFTTKANLSANNSQSIKIWVDLPADSYRVNDTLKLGFYNSPLISSFPYLQDFETGNGSWYSDGINNSWQYGTPASVLIKSAASGSKAWKTSLSGNYKDQEESYLYSPCLAVSGLQSPTLSFSVALDFEVCDPIACDIAYMEYSGDGGVWTRLGQNGQETNWYNKVYSGSGSWSEQSYTRWHVATIALPKGFATLRLRFVMKSDPFVNREGIAIDDIHIYDRVNGIYDETSMTSPVSQSIAGSTNWVDFTRNGKLIASVNSNNQNFGATDVQAYINTGAVRNTNEQYYLNRNITIKPANGNFANQAKVRIYFLDSEVESLLNATGCSTCLKPFSAYDLGISKYTNADRSKEDGEILNSTLGNWSFITSADALKVPFDKGYYVEMKVKDFSEFWLSKSLLSSTVALPVELISFTAKRKTEDDTFNDVLLEWTTSSEENFHLFELEVATGNEDYRLNRFVKIGEISGRGNGSSNQKYAFTDTEVNKSGARYYRLKMVDLDGSFAYSKVRPVVFDNKVTWHVYPNPSVGIFNVVYQANAGQPVIVKVYDLTGRFYFKSNGIGTGFIQKHKIDLSGSDLSSGLYLLEVNTGIDKQAFKVFKD